ncbi:major facilitator superfamily domain-containing protein [Mycena maculata]|uniref:Major facilitator superfamily domain-containing protein n=1 Tax=Mycena maculata TaxID=230809 RepID=A0AAD7KAP5_9AGAR|nr:major facilitator superfamily domain-containing protein [Mycena maculata]
MRNGSQESPEDDAVTVNEKSPEVGLRDELEIEKEREASPDESEFPEGGFRAWLVVAGTMAGTISTFGYVNAWGVFQAYYEETILKDVPASNIAWIGSIQYSLVFFPGLVTGRLFDLGYFKIPYAIASTLLVVSTFLVAQCTQYWHFVLCQGLATGLSCGVIFGPNIGVIGHWFKKKRGLAMGVSAMGSSIGGTVFPIATHKLIPLVGFPWTMRICAFILICTLGFANLAVARRLPPKNVKGGLFNLQAFKAPAYTIYCLSGFVAFLGLYTVLTYIDVAAVSFGISPEFSFYLISIANGCSLFGRLAGGVVSDRVGPLNVLVPMTLVAAGMTFAWPHARTESTLIAIAVLYGIVSGTYVSTFPLPIVELGEVADVGRRTGMALTAAALGALAGPPISGAINTATGGFEAVGYYAGSTIILAVVLMAITRHLISGRLWRKI